MSYRMTRRLIVATACSLALLRTLPLNAGPSFNPDRDVLAKASEGAGAELHLGLQKVHEMLMYLELRDLGRADAAKSVALKHLDVATEAYEKVAKLAPNQKIVVKTTTPSEDSSVQAFRERLRERKIQMPSTERELAELAVVAVREYAGVLRESKFKATRSDYERLRVLLRSQALLLDLGILTSIAWTVSAPVR